jgi:predicted nucleic acid-binding protein
LIQGCSNKIEQSKLETTIEGIDIVWPLPDTCDDALSIFGQFHLSHGIGFLDALIGQMAISLDLPLHTFNRKHYSVIPNLETIQPYIKS